ncbi:MAG: fibronectin type III domain-containing protein [Nocardioides sp.]|uniref:fibronectin type III domain-containing protein n=1 Tax=Nocardioides sp. TaxID=35761 RepID=UPI003EFCCE9F
MRISSSWDRRALSVLASLLLVVGLSITMAAAPAHAESEDTIVAWGRNTWGEAEVPAGMTNVKQISVTAHSVVLLDDGTVRSWGHDTYGEAQVPTGLADVVEIAAGGFHTMALRGDGSLVVWGLNTDGQTDVPPGLTDIAAISGGRFHSLVLHGDGTVTAWGSNSHGQSTVPAGLDDVVAIDGGGWHNLALRSDGTVVAWGDNSYGQSSVPAGLDDVVAIAAGWNHSLALRSDGTVVAWGSNEYGQSSVPADLPPVAQISAGGTHSLVALADGTVRTWGDSNYGIQNVPTGITGVTQISSKAMHSMVLADDPAPTPVRNLVASLVTSAKVTLNWGYPDQPSDRDVTKIVVRKSSGDQAPATITDGVDVPLSRALQQYVTDESGMSVGERVSYSVFAQDRAGNVSRAASITVPVAFPGPVTSLAATVASPTSLDLTWTNPANDQLKKIIVRRAVGTTPPATPTSGSNVTLATAIAEGVTNTGLAPGTTYSYSVFAQDRIGNISPLGPGSVVSASPSGTVTPPTGAGPAPVTNLAAPIVSNAKVNLTWQYPSGTARIVVRGAPGETAPATPADGVDVTLGRAVTTSATDPTGLEVGQRYSYSVFTFDAEGRPSVPISITVPVAFPSPITNATAAPSGANALVLTWTNPTNDQLKKIIVRRAVGSTPPPTPTSGSNVSLDIALATTVTNTGLVAGTTYSYSFFAQDRIGNISPLGAGSTLTATTVPLG